MKATVALQETDMDMYTTSPHGPFELILPGKGQVPLKSLAQASVPNVLTGPQREYTHLLLLCIFIFLHKLSLTCSSV
jgi:hypothetical protein